jgi:hypothetical protein
VTLAFEQLPDEDSLVSKHVGVKSNKAVLTNTLCICWLDVIQMFYRNVYLLYIQNIYPVHTVHIYCTYSTYIMYISTYLLYIQYIYTRVVHQWYIHTLCRTRLSVP